MKRVQTIVAEDGDEKVKIKISLNLKRTDAYNKQKAASSRIAMFTDSVFKKVLADHFHLRDISIR
jgi:hypothetical protein